MHSDDGDGRWEFVRKFGIIIWCWCCERGGQVESWVSVRCMYVRVDLRFCTANGIGRLHGTVSLPANILL